MIRTDREQLIELVRLVFDMRAAQRAHSKALSQESLTLKQQREQAVDRACAAIMEAPRDPQGGGWDGLT